MRMEQASNRDEMIRRYADSVDGIIYHTVQFCDNYAYEYAWLKEWLKRPVLLLETDYTRQRLRSDSDQNRGVSGVTAAEAAACEEEHGGRQRQCSVLGIDSGSTSTNAVIMGSGTGKIVGLFPWSAPGAKSGESGGSDFEEVLDKASPEKGRISPGSSPRDSGRVSIDFADENVTEISCHGKGAHYFNPKIRTILDIGGQDSKAIKLSETGDVSDFVMNDKCAAGTGRFLEMIARSLEVSLDELGAIALESKEKNRD